MDMDMQPEDWAREQRIKQLAEQAGDATDPVTQRDRWHALQTEIKARTPAAVNYLECVRGLR